MVDEIRNIDKTEPALLSRRKVVTTATQVAVTAPAVAVLLSSSSKSAFAVCNIYGQGDGCVILDDFTFGNSGEDIDAATFSSNFNPINGQTNQDDHV
jgi:hypothetical protein